MLMHANASANTYTNAKTTTKTRTRTRTKTKNANSIPAETLLYSIFGPVFHRSAPEVPVSEL